MKSLKQKWIEALCDWRWWLCLGLLIMAIVLFGCVAQVKELPKATTHIKYTVHRLYSNFNLVQRKEVNEEKCYIVVRVEELAGEQNAWQISGLKEGDWIVLYGNRPGAVASIPCQNNDTISVAKWFLGKARPHVNSHAGWAVERLRFYEDYPNVISIELATVIVSVHNYKERLFGKPFYGTIKPKQWQLEVHLKP